MIDVQKALNEYNKYIKNYNIKDDKIALKVAHMLRVKENSKNIAQSLNLETEDVELAELIGLLHDIGRFEQVKRYNTFVDKNSVNHGAFGAKILFEDGLSEREMLHAKIIRDADKLDIFNVALKEKPEAVYESEHLEKETFTDEIFREFMNNEQLDYSKIKTHADVVICHFRYVFDLNYKYSFQVVNENKYLERLYKRIHFERRVPYEKNSFTCTDNGFCVYLRPVGVRQLLWRRVHRPHVPCGHDAGRNPGVFPP